jgi:LuxR family maltose regulon positive regulatory protein
LVDSPSGEVAAERNQQDILTLRETAILKLVADGMANKEIARLLSISGNTVQTHLRNMYQKLQTTNRTHAVARAREQGLLS